MTKPLLLKNGRIIDPANKRDERGDLLIIDGRISLPQPKADLPEGVQEINVEGKWILPGLIDIHVHFREPGQEYKEDILSGARAAAAGGFTAVACMPNTKPALDNEQLIAFVAGKAKEAAITVYPIGTISAGLEGKNLADMGAMRQAGAVAFTDDGCPVSNSQLMRRALEYAANFSATIISHSEDLSLAYGGVINEGSWSTRLGVRGIPNVAESIAVYRDIALSQFTGSRLHLAHISAKESVELIRFAKAQGAPITAETAPHYFTLTESAISLYNSYAKMNPPLRTEADVSAIKEGLQDGTLDAIATDHAPHNDLEKILEFDKAANGIIGLETSLPLTLRLVKDGTLSPSRLVELLSRNPAQIIGVEGGTLSEGVQADVTVVDPEKKYLYSRESVVSKSKNSPFLDWELEGKAYLTIVKGKIVYDAR